MSKDINAAVSTMAEKLQGKISFDDQTGVPTMAEDAYESVLPEDLTIELATKVNKHNTNFMAASGKAFVDATVEFIGKNQEFLGEEPKQMDLVISGVGKDTFSHSLTVDKAAKSANLLSGYTFHGAGASRGELKKVHDYLNDKIAAALGE